MPETTPANSRRKLRDHGSVIFTNPEMLHAAASGTSFACFVRPDTRIPLMTMPDAIDSIVRTEC